MTRSVTVLVVDDAAAIRLLCRVNLELDGNRVFDAATVEQAREILGRDDVDVVLLDVHVGAADGLELLDEIRRDYPEVAVALLTGSSELERVRTHGPDAVLGKPFELEDLRRIIADLTTGSPNPV
jgi:DNA-binding NtrC family response regulator